MASCARSRSEGAVESASCLHFSQIAGKAASCDPVRRSFLVFIQCFLVRDISHPLPEPVKFALLANLVVTLRKHNILVLLVIELCELRKHPQVKQPSGELVKPDLAFNDAVGVACEFSTGKNR